VQNLPESLAVPQLFRRPAAERNHPTADPKAVLGSCDLRGGKIKLKSFRITVDEIEDSVPARIQSRNQVRPRHRALRRDARRQAPERSLRLQPRKVRH